MSAVVVNGTPTALEDGSYTDRNGVVVPTLNFKLSHEAIALGFPVLCETRGDTIEKVKAAHEGGYPVSMVAVPAAIRSDKTDDNGRPKDWVKLNIRAVLD